MSHPETGRHDHGHPHGQDHHHDHEHHLDHEHNDSRDHDHRGHRDHDHGRPARLRHLLRPHSHEPADQVDAALEASAEGMRTLWISLAVTMAGFFLFWLAGAPGPGIAGLFLCGLGVANLYPLSLALVLAAAPDGGDSANGAVALLGGILTVASPYLLGSLADQLGLHAAFAVEPVLVGACAVLLLAGLRAARSS